MQNIFQDISTSSFEFSSYPSLSSPIETLTDTASQCLKIMKMDEWRWQQVAGSACPGSMHLVPQDNIVNEKMPWNLRRFLTTTAKQCVAVLQKNETDWQHFC